MLRDHVSKPIDPAYLRAADLARSINRPHHVRTPMTAERDPRRLTPIGKFWLAYLLLLLGGALWLAL